MNPEIKINSEHQEIDANENIENSPEINLDSFKDRVKSKIKDFRKGLQPDMEMINQSIDANLDIGLQKYYKEIYSKLVELDDEAFNLENLTEEQIDQLESERNLNVDEYVGITVEEFSKLPTITKRNLLQRHGLSRKQMAHFFEIEDFTAAIEWVDKIDRSKTEELGDKIESLRSRKGGYDNEYYAYIGKLAHKIDVADVSNNLWVNKFYTNKERNNEDSLEKLNSYIKNLFEDSFRPMVEDEQNGKKELYVGGVQLIALYRNLPDELRNNDQLKEAIDQLQEHNPNFARELSNPSSEINNILEEYWENGFDKKAEQGIRYLYEQDMLVEKLEKLLDGNDGKDMVAHLYNENNIVNFHRYSDELLQYQYIYRNDDRPKGVLVVGQSDHNGAFTNDQNIWDKVMKQSEDLGLNFKLGEASSTKQFYSEIKKWSTNESNNKVEFLIVAGHGSPDSIQLGRQYKAHSSILSSDVTQNAMSERLKDLLAENAPIVLVSCSTGKSSVDGKEFFAQKYSELMDRQIIGPEIPTNVHDIDLTENNGKIKVNVQYGNLGNVYKSGKLEKSIPGAVY